VITATSSIHPNIAAFHHPTASTVFAKVECRPDAGKHSSPAAKKSSIGQAFFEDDFNRSALALG